MSVYTKKGDKGQTDLIGERTTKCDVRVEAYGKVDTLNSYINLVMSQNNSYNEYLIRISNYLFSIGHDLSQTNNLKYKVDNKEILWLEKMIDDLSNKTGLHNKFILPGGTVTASTLHICRSICRECERKIVKVQDYHEINEYVLKYINRLSDFLYILACYENHINNADVIEVTYD